MNTVRIGLITLCAAASVGAWLSLRDTATRRGAPPQATRAHNEPFAASNQAVGRDCGTAAEVRPLNTARETARARQIGLDRNHRRTLDELLDALDADIGEDGEPIDREAVGASLRTDPALAGH